jgi:hypothetical protein
MRQYLAVFGKRCGESLFLLLLYNLGTRVELGASWVTSLVRCNTAIE